MLKMNKAERKEYILKESDIMAKTGKYSDFMSIELVLRSKGLEDARSVLDDSFIRENLNEICKTAQSPIEVENRKLFDHWVSEIVPALFVAVKKEFPEANINLRDNSFSISIGGNSLDISKQFASRKLTGVLHFTNAEGESYKMNYEVSKKDFEELNETDLIALTKKVSVKR